MMLHPNCSKIVEQIEVHSARKAYPLLLILSKSWSKSSSGQRRTAISSRMNGW